MPAWTTRFRIVPSVALVLALVLLLGTPTRTVRAATPEPSPTSDQLQLVRLTTGSPDLSSPPGTVRFEAQITYHLETSPEAFLLLFIFEDDAEFSSQQTSYGIPIRAGDGQVSLDIDYVRRPDVQMLTLLIGLFTPAQELLGWVATNPLPLAPWAGRSEFERAMAARLAGNYSDAIHHLSTAIELSPETGNFYYWRADTRVRAGEYEEAILDYTTALELMPQHQASMLGRGVAWLWTEQWQAAVTDLTAVIATSNESDRVTGWAFRARAFAYIPLGRLGDAIADFRAYLALTPHAPDQAQVETWIGELLAASDVPGEDAGTAGPS